MNEQSRDNVPLPGDNMARYARQTAIEVIGEDGQQKLARSRVLLVGCGALGTVLAETLVRAGVGFLRICDRDYIELDNLQRQVLFDEHDMSANLPKAEAAAAKLTKINGGVTVEPVVVDVNHTNIERLAAGCHLFLDGTDNFETRFLINDFAVKTGTPWVYGAAIGTTGLCMPILPNETPCLRCVFEEAPPPEMNPTCDTAGVLATVVNVVASLQATEAMKILLGRMTDVNRDLVHLDVWSGRFSRLKVQSTYDQGDCPCCKHDRFDYLSGALASGTTTLCGRNAVQVSSPLSGRISLEKMAAKVEAGGGAGVSYNAHLLKATIEGCDLTLFPDGRAIIKGTDDGEKARSLYARYVGA